MYISWGMTMCMLPVHLTRMCFKPSLPFNAALFERGKMKSHLRVREKHDSVQAVGMDDLESFKIILQAMSHQQCLC